MKYRLTGLKRVLGQAKDLARPCLGLDDVMTVAGELWEGGEDSNRAVSSAASTALQVSCGLLRHTTHVIATVTRSSCTAKVSTIMVKNENLKQKEVNSVFQSKEFEC
jgi:hypothetical protein